MRNAAIVKTFDPKDPKDEESIHFIHSTGGMFVLIPNYSSSYLGIRSRHSSANTAAAATLSNAKGDEGVSKLFENTLDPAAPKSTQSPQASYHTPSASISSSSSSLNPVKLDTISESNDGPDAPTTANTTLMSMQKRDRSNSKSQQLEFLRLNQKNYLSDNIVVDDVDTSASSNNADSMSTTNESTSQSARVLLNLFFKHTFLFDT